MTSSPQPGSSHSAHIINCSPFSSPRANLATSRQTSPPSPSVTEMAQKTFSAISQEYHAESPVGRSSTDMALFRESPSRLTPIRVYDLRSSPALNDLINRLPTPNAPSVQELPLFAALFHEQIQQMLQNELIESRGNLKTINEHSLSSLTSFSKFINEFDLLDIFKNQYETQYIVDCLDQLTSTFSEVTSLSVIDHPHLGDEVLEAITKWTELKVLNFTNSVKLFAQSPGLLNSHFDYLTELYLGQSPGFLDLLDEENKIFSINDQNLHFITLKFSLSKLDISGAMITPATSFKLGYLTQLTYLNLSNCFNLKSDSFAFLSNLGLLEEIDLSGIEITQEALLNIGRTKKIKKITLSLEAISRSHENRPGFSLQQLVSQFLSIYPHVTLSVPPNESENLKRILNDHSKNTQRTSKSPNVSSSLDLPDL